MLSTEQLQFFQTEGYLVVEDFATEAEVVSLRDRANVLLQSFDPISVSVFSTTSVDKIKDDYLLKSAGDIFFFLEEGAVDENGKLRYEKSLAVNKIAHAMHDLDPVFRQFSRSSNVCSIFKALGYNRPIPVQSMYICKQPRIGGYVIPHQDSTFLYTDPPSVIGVWVALEDATIENGCLFVLPKSHNNGIAIRYGKSDQGAMQVLEGEKKDWNLDDFVALPAKAGTMVLLHGCVVHFSHENTSEKSRHAYTVHYIEGTADYKWKDDNWLQRPEDFPFEPLYNP